VTRYFLGALTIEGFRGINNDGDPLVLKFKRMPSTRYMRRMVSGKARYLKPFTMPFMARFRV